MIARTHRVEILSSTAGEPDAFGAATRTVSTVATNVLGNLQLLSGEVLQLAAGRAEAATHRLFVPVGTPAARDQFVRVTGVLLRGAGNVGNVFRITDAYHKGGRWDTELRLRLTSETLS